MKFSKFFLSFAILGIVACGDDSSSSPDISQKSEINALDEKKQIFYFMQDNGYCDYKGNHLTWKNDVQKKAYKYEIENDTLILFNYDLETSKAAKRGDVFVDGGKELFDTWTAAPCKKEKDEITCDQSTSAIKMKLKISEETYTVQYFTNSKFDFAESPLLKDIVDAAIDEKEFDPAEWNYSMNYKKGFWDKYKEEYGVKFESNSKTSIDITINGLTFKVRDVESTIDEEKSTISATVTAAGLECDLDYTYYAVNEDNCLDENFQMLNITEEGDVYGYTESNEKDFVKCLHTLYRSNALLKTGVTKVVPVEEDKRIKLPLFQY